MKCTFCGRELRYDFEIKVGICESCMLEKENKNMKNIRNFNDFEPINEEGIFKNKLPNFEMTAKVKKIVMDVNGEKVEAMAGGHNGSYFTDHTEGIENNFYFRTDKKNTDILKKHGIRSVDFIDTENNVVIFNDNFYCKIECPFKVKFLSRRDIGEYWEECEEGGYVSWKLSENDDYDYDDL